MRAARIFSSKFYIAALQYYTWPLLADLGIIHTAHPLPLSSLCFIINIERVWMLYAEEELVQNGEEANSHSLYADSTPLYFRWNAQNPAVTPSPSWRRIDAQPFGHLPHVAQLLFFFLLPNV